MTQFNQDGSLKISELAERKKADIAHKMKNLEYLQINRSVVRDKAPKQCCLHLTLSDAFLTNFFVEKVYTWFTEKSEVPTKLIKITEQEFKVEIGTCFRRCSDCNSLINRFRNFLDGRVIENKGTCTQKEHEFCYEDHF